MLSFPLPFLNQKNKSMLRINPFAKRKYARLVYSGTRNIGDEIQTLAAQAFLPQIDMDADREYLNNFQAKHEHFIILNGWYMHHPENWPPSKYLNPLFISFHITSEILGQNTRKLRPSDFLLQGANFDYLRAHGPIGARDLHTCHLLNSAGIPSYFSGCMTLTLKASQPIARRDGVVAVDIPEELTQIIEKQQNLSINRMTHENNSNSVPHRFENAKAILQRYAASECVITSRLHCALPCLALGTPVLFIDLQPDRYRFAGLIEFLHSYRIDHIVRGAYDFNLKDPPQNCTAWHIYRDEIIQRTEQFTGAIHRAAF